MKKNCFDANKRAARRRAPSSEEEGSDRDNSEIFTTKKGRVRVAQMCNVLHFASGAPTGVFSLLYLKHALSHVVAYSTTERHGCTVTQSVLGACCVGA